MNYSKKLSVAIFLGMALSPLSSFAEEPVKVKPTVKGPEKINVVKAKEDRPLKTVGTTTDKQVSKDIKLKERATERFSQALDTLSKHADTMSKNQTKIAEFLNRFEMRGVNVSASKAELEKGKSELAKAKASIEATRTKIKTLDLSKRENLKVIETSLKTIRVQLKTAHEATMKSIQMFKAASKVKTQKTKGDKATNTPPVIIPATTTATGTITQ